MKSLLDKIEYSKVYTPDLAELTKYECVPLFTYGTLMTGNKRHELLKSEGEFLGESMTVRMDYEMVETSDFPVALMETGNKSAYGRIKGELWLVPIETLIDLDHVEKNGKLFIRQHKLVYHKGNVEPTFMYIGNNKYWMSVIQGLDQVYPENKVIHWKEPK
jgi:gamma-glutamylcyclotransferase (GGCT)/AIG2-like uncharacterized protein YtfP